MMLLFPFIAVGVKKSNKQNVAGQKKKKEMNALK